VACGINAEVRAGNALRVTGPNGAGKSTFALTVAGLLAPHGGCVVAGDALRAYGGGSAGPVGPNPFGWSSAELIARIGTVFQEPEHQFVTGRVADELAFGPRALSGCSASRTRRSAGQNGDLAIRIDELLERLRLTHLADANPFTLSGGEKRRLSVATVLVTSPAVLVLDEPTFGQDATTWAELATLLIELLDAGSAVVCATHDAEFAAALGGNHVALEPETTVGAAP
jgi:energy-coupling factor transport system ATP-binding protein